MNNSPIIILCTNSLDKVREYRQIFAACDMDVTLLIPSDFGYYGEPNEIAVTYEGNAMIKADAFFRDTYITIADDSGLGVLSLNKAPGVDSANYAYIGAHDAHNCEKLLKELGKKTDRSAKFIAVIACILPNGERFTVRGECEGEILAKASGANGFGYDSLFYYPPMGKSFAEMTAEEKNSVSHRVRAVELLIEQLKNKGY